MPCRISILIWREFKQIPFQVLVIIGGLAKAIYMITMGAWAQHIHDKEVAVVGVMLIAYGIALLIGTAVEAVFLYIIARCYGYLKQVQRDGGI